MTSLLIWETLRGISEIIHSEQGLFLHNYRDFHVVPTGSDLFYEDFGDSMALWRSNLGPDRALRIDYFDEMGEIWFKDWLLHKIRTKVVEN